MQAYLVIREGPQGTDVFRLTPGRTVTIGRTATNQIVIKDERCSRYHAEIFLTQGEWILRDLDSRNGTLVNNQRVRGDSTLHPGDIITIAHIQMAFVHELSQAFVEPTGAKGVSNEPTVALPIVDPQDQPSVEDLDDADQPATITHRFGQTRLLRGGQPNEELTGSRLGQAAARLCRLAFELAAQPDVASVARVALDGLFASTNADAGAILLITPAYRGEYTGTELQVVASRSDRKPSYHRVPRFLANMVLRDGEAVLARNVEDDRNLGVQDSKGEIQSTGVLCAPIRQDGRVVGLIHLYSTASEKTPDPDDLEFTLAVADNLALALRNLARQQELAERLSQSRSEVVQLRSRLGVESDLVGSSAAMLGVQQQIAQAAPSRATVLIRGESGVGKELVARAIHVNSPRKKGPFVCLNCAALSESLLESELFGHEKGAFTGATDRKIGKFEAADEGTLMLDEIGEMSPAIQAKFLRVLEGHPFERVGGNQPIKVDVRVIAATNRDLEKAVADGQFRRDLFFRLRVVEVQVPPLRRRTDDIRELAEFFLQRFNQETGKKIQGYTTDALQRMREYRWPGNVRELKNVVERAVVLARRDFIDVDDLMLSTLSTVGDTGEIAPASGNVYEPLTLDEVERRHILSTLHSTGWNKSRAATILAIERTTLDRKIQKYGLTPPR
jgi:transcriptional regulator with GAF, ATPase, and Fis domain/pSer/pThr/pTyr-binding forkhead associated (FHA) protein